VPIVGWRAVEPGDEKQSLRRDMRAVRRTVAADEQARSARSRTMWDSVVDEIVGRLGDSRSLKMMLYQSLPTEPDTSTWFDDATGRGWSIHLPEVDGVELRVMPGDVDPGTLDVVVFPGLAFTSDGRRLGQGGGHYDRFATRLATSCVRIGTCFREQLVEDLPTSAYDESVDVVVTA